MTYRETLSNMSPAELEIEYAAAASAGDSYRLESVESEFDYRIDAEDGAGYRAEANFGC
jgi:hypothetical protein